MPEITKCTVECVCWGGEGWWRWKEMEGEGRSTDLECIQKAA